MKNIVWFNEVDHGDLNMVGGKGANLGEMTKAGLPVPNGFIVTAQAYYEFLKKAGISNLIDKALKGLNPEDTKKLNEASKAIKKAVMDSSFPVELDRSIKEYYEKMSPKKDLLVAVRSSATAEDLPDASFAGQQATFLNIKGTKQVIHAVKECFASLFEPRAIYYRIVNKYDHMKIGIAVPVQEMVQSRVSGIMFTVDPVTGDRSKLVIEAGYGLGEAIVSGSVTPDRYLVDKASVKIIDKEINTQEWCIVKDPTSGKDVHKALKSGPAKSQKLRDDLILEVAKLGLAVEKHYKAPQDTEWAMYDDKVYMVQARPITTLKKTAEISGTSSPAAGPAEVTSGEIIIKGAAASVGIASGTVKIIHSPKEIDQIQKGDVLVTEMTNPEYVPAMRRATAIVTDAGGRTSHAAIVSRELGIPCVVGTGQATSKLKTGMTITVDGAQGIVYKGSVTVPPSQSAPTGQNASARPMSGSLNEEIPITGTKVYVNLAEPEKAQEVASLPVDGVGLMRAEFIIAGMGEHPRAMVEAGRSKEYVAGLVDGMVKIASAFDPRPVIYRASDFKTNEYRDLKGGDKYEPQESNPMIGYRGAFRYINEPDLFKLELEAIKTVREEHGLKNLWMMIPFVRTVHEWKQVRDMVHASGLPQTSDFKLLMMCEIPANVILLEDFIAEGIDGVSIGSNDLTQLTVGVDRDSIGKLAAVFDERDKAVIKSLEYIVKTCRKHGKSVSICGQAPSVYPEITEMLVKAGTTSVSVSQDVAISTRKLIASVERRMMLNQVVDHFENEENKIA